MSSSASTSTSTRNSTSQVVTLPDLPALYDPNFLDALLPSESDFVMTDHPSPSPAPTNPMIDALKTLKDRGLTQNMADAYTSTGSAVLDAFQMISDFSSSDNIGEYLSKAWKEDPSLTLKIIWNIRSIHNGKGESEMFYRAFGWLYENHPRTAISNLHLLVDTVCAPPKHNKYHTGLSHGYWKDLLNILCLATRGELHERRPTFLHTERPLWSYPGAKSRKRKRTPRPSTDAKATGSVGDSDSEDSDDDEFPTYRGKKKSPRVPRGAAPPPPPTDRAPGDPEKYKVWQAEQRAKAYQKFEAKILDPKETAYRALYIQVARLFAERLEKDVELMKELAGVEAIEDRFVVSRKISLAGKWAPSPGGAHDRVCNISTAIALLLKSSKAYSCLPKALSEPVPAREEALLLRSMYQRWVLTELRKVIKCPEPLMSTKRWLEVDYSRVPSKCMSLCMPLFYMHDKERFLGYLAEVEGKKSKMSGATLMPHELVAKALGKAGSYPGLPEDAQNELRDIHGRVVEAQWKSLIENLKGYGALENCIAICDVSGSMGSIHGECSKKSPQPIFPAIALSLVLAHLAKPPFNAGFITFSSQPEFIQLDLSKSLSETVTSMSRANWTMNTDLNAVFTKLLLPLAIKNKVKPEDMIQRLFVFSDMQFDSATTSQHHYYRFGTAVEAPSSSDWDTNYDAIEKAYKEAGYEVPQIVYWDLSTGQSFQRTVEVQSDKKGVAMMNGFSPAMLKVFMGVEEEEEEEDEDGCVIVKKEKDEEEFTPMNVMLKVLGNESYAGLKVED